MRIACLVLVVACGGQPEPARPVPPQPTPKEQAQHDCKTMAAELARTMPSSREHEDEMRSNARVLIANRCTEDRWSSVAVACIRDADTSRAQAICINGRLSDAQQTALFRAIGPLIKQEQEAQERPARQRAHAEQAMAKMAEFKDMMCACRDPACAERVSDEMTKWSQEMSRSRIDPPKMSEADANRAAAIGEAMGRCMQAAMQGPPRK